LTRLDRGGSPSATDDPLLPDTEQYELEDYKRIQKRQELEAEGARRAAKNAGKARRLDEEDEMKFSHSIQFNAVPDWSSHYIAYSNLKKLLVYALSFRLPSGLLRVRICYVAAR
jgi:phosphate transporter